MFKFFKKFNAFLTPDINLRYYIYNGILFTLMTTFSKSYAIKFLDRIGGNSFHYSLFNALPGFIAIFVTIPGILLMNKSINKKRMMASFFIASRSFTLLFALVPFLPYNLQPIGFVLLTALMNLPDSISLTTFQSYSGDIFLPSERANAISMRNKFSTLAQVISMAILGAILRIPKNNESSIRLYQVLFVIAFLLGMWEILTLSKLKEKNCVIHNKNISLKNSLRQIFSNKKFNIFLICSILFHFGWQMGWPLFNLYQISYLGADELWLTILNVTSNLVMVFSFGLWNNLIKKRGNALTISLATLGMSITPILFVFSPNLYVMTLAGLVTGFFTSGTLTVILSSLLEVSSDNERMLCIGIHATLTNITLAFAPMVGNWFLNSFNIYTALIATSIFRLIGSFSFFIRNKNIKNFAKHL